MSHFGKLFIVLEFILYAALLAIDILNLGSSTAVKYTGIILCIFFCFAAVPDKNDRLTALALLFTGAADLFLLVLNSHYIIGILFFCLVQFLYCLKLFAVTGKCVPQEIVLRLGLPAAVTLMLGILGQCNLLNSLAAFYFCNLVINGIKSWICTGPGLFTLGLILFICCDICVGLFNVIPEAGELYRVVSIGMWAFYLPSQVLIALTVILKRERRTFL